MRRTLLLLGFLLVLAMGCGRQSRKALGETVRTALNPPVPPDTIPEMLEYDADLGVNVAEMIKLPGGALYADVAPGQGDSVVAGDSVEVAFQGWLPDGTKVDSGGAVLRVGAGDVPPGVDAALPGMKTGGRRKLVLSPGLGYGAEGRDNIPPNAVLVYDLELVTVFR